LRKPTVAAWAINQLVRDAPAGLDELLELGERLRHAQSRALSGAGGGSLKELLVQRRQAVEQLARKAVDRLGPNGEAQRDAIVATLEAALADEDAAAEVRGGRLVKDLPPPAGFGMGGFDIGTDSDVSTDVEAHKDEQQPKERKRAQQVVDDARGALRQANEELDAARREEEAAHEEVARLERSLTSARERADDAAERVRLADRRITRAQTELEEAEASLARLAVV
jgi:hypothetical protein